jgi:hypothetical protein
MTLLLRPRGRGNWVVVTMRLDGARVESLFVQPGQTFFFGGLTWRIVSVLP